jgi:formamidopyrimidine-DNA glycosylase
MSGRLYVRKEKDTAQTHERAHVQLDKGNAILVLRDVRTLGTIQYFAADEVITPLAKLGWEPLSEKVSATEFRAALRGRKSAIKPVLLDQTLWAGIGNIYAAEALWEARIDPRLRANQLSLKRCDLLGEVIVKVLRRALSKGGSTLRDFMSPEGNAGEYSGEFRVYGREGESCYRCGATIKRIVQAQRATFYCAGCQKMKG